MLHAILTDPDNGYLYIRADGQLGPQDYENFVPSFRQLVKSDERKLPLMIELGTDFDGGAGMRGLWDALRLDDASQRDRFSRIAVVGDSGSQPPGAGSVGSEVRLFEHAKRANAEQWLMGQPITELP